MKQLIWRVVCPLTVITFFIFTKWWYALPVDARDTLFWGFPFPYAGEGWHTSMSLQFFLLEFFTDVLVYFLFWLITVFCLNKFVIQLKPPKTLTRLLWLLTVFMMMINAIILYSANCIFHIKRPYEIEIMDTGYKFIWQTTQRPDYYKYHPQRNDNGK